MLKIKFRSTESRLEGAVLRLEIQAVAKRISLILYNTDRISEIPSKSNAWYINADQAGMRLEWLDKENCFCLSAHSKMQVDEKFLEALKAIILFNLKVRVRNIAQPD